MWSSTPTFPTAPAWGPDPAIPASAGTWTPVIVRSVHGMELAVATDDGLIRLGVLTASDVTTALDAGVTVLPGLVGAETAVAADWGVLTAQAVGRELSAAREWGSLGVSSREVAVSTDYSESDVSTCGPETASATDRASSTSTSALGADVAAATDVGAGGFAWHAPILASWSTVGTHTFAIPVGCLRLDVVLIGGGASGQTGSGAINQAGRGGMPGSWAAITLIRGVDIPWTATEVSVTIGAGGGQPANSDRAGPNPGQPTTVQIDGAHLGGTAGGAGTGDQQNGRPVPPFTHNAITYNGGNSGTGNAGAGTAPGGAGAGGNGGIFGRRTRGGPGGAGGAWIRAYHP